MKYQPPRLSPEELKRRADAVKAYDAADSQEARAEILRRIGLPEGQPGRWKMATWREQVRKWGAATQAPARPTGAKKDPREFSVADRKQVVAEYMAAPVTNRQPVLIKYGLPPDVRGRNIMRDWKMKIAKEEGAKEEERQVRRYVRKTAGQTTAAAPMTPKETTWLARVVEYSALPRSERLAWCQKHGYSRPTINSWAYELRRRGLLNAANRPTAAGTPSTALAVREPNGVSNGHHQAELMPPLRKRRKDDGIRQLRHLFFVELMKTDAAKEIMARMIAPEED